MGHRRWSRRHTYRVGVDNFGPLNFILKNVQRCENIRQHATKDCAQQPLFLYSSINLQVERGQLIAVVGHVGSGKSSLLSAILGEMIKLRGTVTVSVSPTSSHVLTDINRSSYSQTRLNRPP